MGYELDIVHPAAKRWINERRYYYVHHPTIDGMCPDFICWRSDNDSSSYFILECKDDARQVTDYHCTYQEDKYLSLGLPCVFAVPIYSLHFRDKHRWIRQSPLSIVGLDVSITKRQYDIRNYLKTGKPQYVPARYFAI